MATRSCQRDYYRKEFDEGDHKRLLAVLVELHDYQYLGAGYRERERIKRKKLRWQKMLSKMPALERAAVIEAVEEMRAQNQCRHKFIASNHCLKCGWTPPIEGGQC